VVGVHADPEAHAQLASERGMPRRGPESTKERKGWVDHHP
jgi:hypothetical protein